jgi:predicted esterase
LLQEAIEAGHWYNDLLDDPDLLILHNVPEFERIVSICSERREQAIAQAAQVIQIITPQRGLEPYPLLFTLHGAQSNIDEFAPHWLTAAEQGWMLALPQSSQAYGPGSFSWNDWDWARQELQKHFEAICIQYPIDRNRVVLAGFSQGGGLAAWLGLTEAISACGLLLVGPFLENADSTLAWIKDRHTPGIKAYLVAGQRDIYCLGIARKLAKILPQHNIPTKLDEYPDSEHSFPIDFEQRLPEALKFLV